MYHSIHIDTLKEIADSFALELSMLIDQILTHYVDNSQYSNSVLNLMFLHVNAEEFNNHSISPNLLSGVIHTRRQKFAGLAQ